MLRISQLFIYPIKSMGGVAVDAAEVTDRGLKFDRRWMLVDEQNTFITQRSFPKMAMLKLHIAKDHLTVSNADGAGESLKIPFNSAEKETCDVGIWNAICKATVVSHRVNEWFSDALQTKCRLVYMPDDSMRPVDTTSGYAPEGKFTSFADAYPFLLLGEASVADLNSRLQTAVTVGRFRPNLVFTGGRPYQEDDIEGCSIGGVSFTGLENCGRCSMVNINQDSAQVNKEPLAVLAGYRRKNNSVYFGRNLVHAGLGKIAVGDEIIVH